MAVRRPGLVDRLVLSSPAIDPTARRVPTLLGRWVREVGTQSRGMKKLLVPGYIQTGIRRALATLRHVLRDRMEGKLPFVQAPTLVVWGTDDPIVPFTWAQEVASLVPDGRLVVLPGAPTQ